MEDNKYDGNILPIEVKSGKDYYIHSALTHCVENENYEIKEAIVFANCNVHKEGKVVYLPVYMVTFLNKNNAQELVADRIEF